MSLTDCVYVSSIYEARMLQELPK